MLLEKRLFFKRKNRKAIYNIYLDSFRALKDASEDFIVLSRRLDELLDKFKYQDHMYKLICDVKQDAKWAENVAHVYSMVGAENIVASVDAYKNFTTNYYKVVSCCYKMREILSIATIMETEELKLTK